MFSGYCKYYMIPTNNIVKVSQEEVSHSRPEFRSSIRPLSIDVIVTIIVEKLRKQSFLGYTDIFSDSYRAYFMPNRNPDVFMPNPNQIALFARDANHMTNIMWSWNNNF